MLDKEYLKEIINENYITAAEYEIIGQDTQSFLYSLSKDSDAVKEMWDVFLHFYIDPPLDLDAMFYRNVIALVSMGKVKVPMVDVRPEAKSWMLMQPYKEFTNVKEILTSDKKYLEWFVNFWTKIKSKTEFAFTKIDWPFFLQMMQQYFLQVLPLKDSTFEDNDNWLLQNTNKFFLEQGLDSSIENGIVYIDLDNFLTKSKNIVHQMPSSLESTFYREDTIKSLSDFNSVKLT